MFISILKGEGDHRESEIDNISETISSSRVCVYEITQCCINGKESTHTPQIGDGESPHHHTPRGCGGGMCGRKIMQVWCRDLHGQGACLKILGKLINRRKKLHLKTPNDWYMTLTVSISVFESIEWFRLSPYGRCSNLLIILVAHVYFLFQLYNMLFEEGWVHSVKSYAWEDSWFRYIQWSLLLGKMCARLQSLL